MGGHSLCNSNPMQNPEFFLSTQFWWLASLIIPIVLGVYAHMRVTGAYRKYAQVPVKGGMTGRDAAAAVMRHAGITNVKIVEIPGEMTDHYDPVRKKLALSSENYHGHTIAAVGVAAHEAGHAIQDKVGYAPMNIRLGLVPTVNFAGSILPFVIMGGFFFGQAGGMLLDIGIGCYLAITVFHLVTLPVEFDASRRAKQQLVALGITQRGETRGINETLDAAGFTYVASFLASLLNLVYLVMLRRERE